MKKNTEEIIKASRGRDNKKYNENICNLLKDLPGLIKKTNSLRSGLIDIIWRLEGKERPVYFLIRTKTNHSIQTFDARKIRPKIEKTLNKILGNEKIDCYFWLIGGDNLPRKNTHGGSRGSSFQKSFREKLFSLQLYIQGFNRMIHVAHVHAFNNTSFLNLVEEIKGGEGLDKEQEVVNFLKKQERLQETTGVFLN